MQNFRNVDCVVTNHNNVRDMRANLKTTKFITVAVCCLVFLCPIGYFLAKHTGSRGDVSVVRTSKPVENLWKNGLFWSRYSFVTHSIDRKPRDWGLARSAFFLTRHFVPRSPFGRRPSVTLPATCRAPARIWLAVIDFQNGEQQTRSGSDKKRRNRLYSRFIKIPLG